jgi:hypothetical protein
VPNRFSSHAGEVPAGRPISNRQFAAATMSNRLNRELLLFATHCKSGGVITDAGLSERALWAPCWIQERSRGRTGRRNLLDRAAMPEISKEPTRHMSKWVVRNECVDRPQSFHRSRSHVDRQGAIIATAGFFQVVLTTSVDGFSVAGKVSHSEHFDSNRITKIRVGRVLLVRRDEAIEPGQFGSANLRSESADTDLACQQDGRHHSRDGSF